MLENEEGKHVTTAVFLNKTKPADPSRNESTMIRSTRVTCA